MWAYAVLAGLQVVGGFQQADQIKNNAAISQRVSDLNAQFADVDAYNAKKAGISEGARYQDVIDSTISAQKSAEAANNIDTNYGTAKDLETDSKLTGMLNILELQRQGREKALGYETQAINTRLGGQMTVLQGQMDASAAQSRGTLGAISTGISGYERSQSAGTGTTSRSGSNSTPQWRQPAASYTDASKTGGYGSGNSWFYGSSPERYSQPTLNSKAGDDLFS